MSVIDACFHQSSASVELPIRLRGQFKLGNVMPKSSWLFRWPPRIAPLCLFLAALGAAAMYASAKLYERKVDRLSERIKSLRVGVSTFRDVQELASNYAGKVTFELPQCSSEKCGFTIRLSNTGFPAFYDVPTMWRLGIRPTYTAATLRVDDDKLRYASFAVYTRTEFGYWLEASFHAVPGLSMYDKCRDDYLGRDSTYAIRGSHLTNGDGGGQIVRTAFGIQASPEEREKAMTLRLSCITAIPSCRTTGDLMPDAHKNLSFEPNRDESFNKECEDYLKKVEVGTGPWSVESAFSADPISLNSWMLTRSTN